MLEQGWPWSYTLSHSQLLRGGESDLATFVSHNSDIFPFIIPIICSIHVWDSTLLSIQCFGLLFAVFSNSLAQWYNSENVQSLFVPWPLTMYYISLTNECTWLGGSTAWTLINTNSGNNLNWCCNVRLTYIQLLLFPWKRALLMVWDPTALASLSSCM